MHGSGKTKMYGRIYCYIKTELDLFALSKGQCKDFYLSINHLFRDAVSRKTAPPTKENILLLSLSTKESQEAGIGKLIKTPNLLLALFPVLPKGYRCSKAVPCQLRRGVPRCCLAMTAAICSVHLLCMGSYRSQLTGWGAYSSPDMARCLSFFFARET